MASLEAIDDVAARLGVARSRLGDLSGKRPGIEQQRGTAAALVDGAILSASDVRTRAGAFARALNDVVRAASVRSGSWQGPLRQRCSKSIGIVH